MNRTRLAQILVALLVTIAALASVSGVGSAVAEPTTTAPETSTTPAATEPTAEPAADVSADEEPAAESSEDKKLPKGFPADLRKLVAGTKEFKAASWFKGVCAERGGDVAAYIGEVFTHEAEMLFWRLPEQQRWNLLASRVPLVDPRMGVRGDPAKMKSLVESGELRPTDKNGWLPGAYPTTRTSEWPSTEPRCANDIQRWSVKATTVWKFQWAEAPDEASLQAMRAAVKHDGDPVRTVRNLTRIAKPCEGEGAFWFCEHAYFLNCDKEKRLAEARTCTQWNVNIARLFAGTDNWLEQNKDVQDRAEEAVVALWKVTPVYIAGKAVASAFAELWGNTVGAVTEFVKDAKEMPEKWANSLKKSAMEAMRDVLPGLASIGTFDLDQGWFFKWYALSAGLGVMVMCLMFVLATVSAARSGGADMLLRDVFAYLPTGLALMMYTPMAADMFQSLMHAITERIIEMSGQTTDEFIEKVSAMLGALTNETLVGGVIMGIVGFGLLFLGMFAVLMGLIMHQIGVPLACVGAAIGYGMLVHPKWRKKALRVPLMIISLMASVPLLFLTLVVVFSAVTAAADASTTGEGKIASAGQLMIAAVGFIAIGLAPFSLLKWAPVLPNEEDADRMGDTGGGGGAAIGGMGAGSHVQRSMNNSHSRNTGHSGAPGGASPGGGGGGRHAAGSSPGGNHSGGGRAGRAAKLAGAVATGPVGGTAALMSKAAKAGGQVGRGAAGAGMRAGAMSAANRAHSVAADSAPSPNVT